MKIKLAPQIIERKVREISPIFLQKVCEVEGAMITDESYISDFFQFPSDEAEYFDLDSKEYVFKRRYYRGPRPATLSLRKDKSNWEENEIRISDPDPSRDELIKRILTHFRVDVTDVIDEPIVEILLYIAENFVPAE